MPLTADSELLVEPLQTSISDRGQWLQANELTKVASRKWKRTLFRFQPVTFVNSFACLLQWLSTSA